MDQFESDEQIFFDESNSMSTFDPTANWLPDDTVSQPGDYYPRKSWFRIPVRVLGCLIDRTFTAFTIIGHSCSERVIPVEMIPFDLRMPNSTFDIIEIMRIRTEAQRRAIELRNGDNLIRVIRVDETYDPRIDNID